MNSQIINSVIVDDERLARNTLKKKLEQIENVEVVAEADSVNTGISVIKKYNPALLFLDIQLYNETGFELLEKVDFKGNVIFITAHDEYAIKAFELNAIDYLLKPISHERLKKAVQRVLSKNSKLITKAKSFTYEDRVVVMSSKQLKLIKLNTVSVIIAAGDYTEIVTKNNEKHLISRSMKDWIKHLPETYFLQIHRSTIVNIEQIEQIEKLVNNTCFVYIKGIEKPYKLSRSYYAQLKHRFL